MSEVLKNLNIRKFATKQGYESATVGDNDLCVVLNDGEPALKTSTMPTASITELGNIYQYTGTTSGTFVHGYFYECVLNSSTYEWQQVNVQPAPVVTDQPNTRIYKRFDNVSRAMNTVLLYPVLRTTDGATAYTGQYEGESVIHLRAYQGLGDLIIGLTRKGGYDVEQRIYKATGVFTSARAYLMADPQNPNTSKIIAIQKQNGTGFYNSNNSIMYAWYSFYGTNNSTSYDLNLDFVEPTKAVSEIPEYKPIQVKSFTNMYNPNLLGHIVQYVEETDGSYTNGYFYRLDGSIEEEPAYLYCSVTTGQDIEVTCTDPDGLISWLVSQTGFTEQTVLLSLFDEEFSYVASATPTFTWAGETLDASQFDTYFSFSTQPATDDEIVWTTPSGYSRAVEYVNGSWTQVDVQPSSGGLPSQTGNAGKLLITDGTNTSWGSEVKPFVIKSTTATTFDEILVLKSSDEIAEYNTHISHGHYGGLYITESSFNSGWVISNGSIKPYRNTASSIGLYNGHVETVYANYLSSATSYAESTTNRISVPNTSGTMVVATPPSADGTYVLKATVVDGVATITWVAE